MTTLTFSGSIDSSSNVLVPADSYQVAVYGSISLDDTGRNPLAALYNASTGSIDLDLSRIRVSLSQQAATHQNDTILVLGALASGSSPSGTTFSPTAVTANAPTSQALAYSGPSGLSIGPAMDGGLFPAGLNLGETTANPLVRIDLEGNITIPPGYAYIITLSELSVIDGSTVIGYVVGLAWNEVAGS